MAMKKGPGVVIIKMTIRIKILPLEKVESCILLEKNY